MILAATLMMLGAQPAEPPRVQRRELSTRGLPITYPQPIGPAINRYQSCLSQTLRGADLTDPEAAFGRGIAQCADTRAASMLQADELLRSMPELSAGDRRERIVRSFDTVDAAHRAHGRQLREIISARSAAGEVAGERRANAPDQ